MKNLHFILFALMYVTHARDLIDILIIMAMFMHKYKSGIEN